MATDFNEMWRETSREELWQEIEKHWEDSSRSRIVMLLAMHHGEALSLEAIEANTGLHADWLTPNLKLLEKQGVVRRDSEQDSCFHIDEDQDFFDYLVQFFRNIERESGHLETLSRWAGGHELKSD